MMKRLLAMIPPRRAPLVTLAIVLATIAGFLVFEHLLGYVPCALCLEQRWPYYIALPIILAAWFVSREANLGRWPTWLMALVGVIFVVSAILGLRHAGVEWGWWEGPADCGGGAGAMSGSIADLNAALSGNTTIVPCDKAAWRFLGISLAGYNFLISLALAAVSFIPAYAAWKERHET
ncbi:disulfide bond formation protein B [Pyruvatibacter mobilis]|jgi:disulfide bond formation protein DsbB|uniref:disulfide bond formation protein B n=1 Tax=Pyruvatibacter mobilis TaxID=1712261 RepID=UPI003BAA8FC9